MLIEIAKKSRGSKVKKDAEESERKNGTKTLLKKRLEVSFKILRLIQG